MIVRDFYILYYLYIVNAVGELAMCGKLRISISIFIGLTDFVQIHFKGI